VAGERGSVEAELGPVAQPPRAVPVLPVEREQLESRAVDLLRTLIRFDTTNPPGNERPAQELLAQRLGAAGFDCQLVGADRERPNLVARLPGRSDGPVLVLLGHIDTVLAEPAEWRCDPWAGELRDGCVWGRGALDMKGQVAATVVAAEALAKSGWRPGSGELRVIVTCDEEAGGTLGARWLCEQRPDLARCDYLINEGGGDTFTLAGRRLWSIGVGEKGVFRFTVRTRGRAGHASTPGLADNALVKLAPLLERLARAGTVPLPSPAVQPVIAALGLPSGAAAIEELARFTASDRELRALLEPMLGVTFAPTMARGSAKINVIPARAELAVDCRVPPGVDRDEALAVVREVVGDSGAELELDEATDGSLSAPEGTLYEFIAAFCVREDPAAQPVPTLLPGFTDSRWFRATFPNCAAYGFFPQLAMEMTEASALIHGADERVPVADLGLAAAFYAEAAATLLA